MGRAWHICVVMRGFLIFLALGACTQFPQLDDTIDAASEAADYPRLVPLEPVLASTRAASEGNRRTEDALQARAAALQNRAARLRQGVVDPKTQDRMRRGVRRD